MARDRFIEARKNAEAKAHPVITTAEKRATTLADAALQAAADLARLNQKKTGRTSAKKAADLAKKLADAVFRAKSADSAAILARNILISARRTARAETRKAVAAEFTGYTHIRKEHRESQGDGYVAPAGEIRDGFEDHFTPKNKEEKKELDAKVTKIQAAARDFLSRNSQKREFKDGYLGMVRRNPGTTAATGTVAALLIALLTDQVYAGLKGKKSLLKEHVIDRFMRFIASKSEEAK